MLIGIIQPYRISSSQKQNENSYNLSYNAPQANSDRVSFNGLKEIEAAEAIIKRHTWGSGILGAFLSQIIGVDSLAHVGNNAWMVHSISKKAYKSNLSKVERRTFQREAALSAAGVRAAAGVITVAPVLGNAVNAGISAKITRMVGDNCVELCEKKLLEPSVSVEGMVRPLSIDPKLKVTLGKVFKQHKSAPKKGEGI